MIKLKVFCFLSSNSIREKMSRKKNVVYGAFVTEQRSNIGFQFKEKDMKLCGLLCLVESLERHFLV